MANGRLGDRWALGTPYRPFVSQRKRRWSAAIVLSAVLLVVTAGIAFGDAATDLSVSINGGATTTTSLDVTVTVGANHCPPGGDMTALEIAFRNSASDAWTVVKAGGAAWDLANPLGSGCSGGSGSTPSPATRDFAWTLASGGAGSRTVYARFKHASDEVFGQDDIEYVVSSLTITGFYEPVHNRAEDGDAQPQVVNGAKAGSTVPLKFNIWDGETSVDDTSEVSAFTQKTPCEGGGTTDMLTNDELSSGSTYLRWDGEQFVFNWKTPKNGAGSCYRVTVEVDGAGISADFYLR